MSADRTQAAIFEIVGATLIGIIVVSDPTNDAVIRVAGIVGIVIIAAGSYMRQRRDK